MYHLRRCSLFDGLATKFLVVLVILHHCYAFSGQFEPGGKPEVDVINPGAEVLLGTLVNIRKRGGGLFGCGERRNDGLTAAEALKWSVDELNKKIWSSSSSNISIGLQVMDSCSRTRIATTQLAEFLPELKSVDVTTGGGDPPVATEAFPYKFAVIDDVGLDNEVDVSNTLDELSIPVIKTSVNTNSEQEIIAAVSNMIQELRWDHVALVHTNSRYSLSMLKTFTKSLKKLDLCVPWIINIENSVVENDYEDLKNALKSGIPILSFTLSDKHDLLLRSLKHAPKQKAKTPILFVDLILRDHLKMAPANAAHLFALVPLPEKESRFEEYFWRNAKMGVPRMEDELELLQRTRVLHKMQAIAEKLSESLKNLVNDFCPNENRICSNALSEEGRISVYESLREAEWSIERPLYGLMEYQFRNANGPILLHKILTYNKYKNVDVFEPNLPYVEVNCEGSSMTYRAECNCLEAKTMRRGSARNIAERHRDGLVSTREKDEQRETPDAPSKKQIDHFSSIPTAFSSFRDPINAILACLILLGSFFTLFTGQYFATFAALPHGGLTSGTSIIGYFILIGLFFLHVTNLSFILTPSLVTCALRRFGTSSSYAVVFSGMMIKVWTVWKQTKNEKPEMPKPSTLMVLSLSLSGVQIVFSGLWLILVPPRIHFDSDKWICYPSGDLDSHLLVSMIYVIAILLATAVLAIQAAAKNINDETRWILISSALVAVLFSCWGIAIATGVWQNHRTAIMNLISATILLSCLYIPKIRTHSKLKKTQNAIAPNPMKLTDDYPVLAPVYPLVLDCNVPPPPSPDDVSDSTYSNQAYSIDGGTESISVPFEIDTSSMSDINPEPLTFSTFFNDIQGADATDDCLDNDPTQVVPSTLYPLDMFNNEPALEDKDHYEPGTNEFTPQHRISSQLYLYPPPEWVP